MSGESQGLCAKAAALPLHTHSHSPMPLPNLAQNIMPWNGALETASAPQIKVKKDSSEDAGYFRATCISHKPPRKSIALFVLHTKIPHMVKNEVWQKSLSLNHQMQSWLPFYLLIELFFKLSGPILEKKKKVRGNGRKERGKK